MSEYTLYRSLCDMGFSQDRASRATDVLLGRDDQLPGEEVPLEQADEFIPSEQDWADYREFCEAYEDRMWAARIESDGYISDRDVLVATGAVG